MDEPIILDDKSREAVHAARDAAQAIEVARHKQIQEVADKVTEFIPDETQLAHIVRQQVENVLARGTEQDKLMILARVPYICQDIKDNKKEMQIMNDRGERIEKKMDEIVNGMTYYPLVQKMVFSFASILMVGVIGTAGTVIIMVLSK